jgi:hypothetical protein
MDANITSGRRRTKAVYRYNSYLLFKENEQVPVGRQVGKNHGYVTIPTE